MTPSEQTQVQSTGDLLRSTAVTLRQANGSAQSTINALSGKIPNDQYAKLNAVLKILQGTGGSGGIDPKDPGLLEGAARYCDAWAVLIDQATGQ